MRSIVERDVRHQLLQPGVHLLQLPMTCRLASSGGGHYDLHDGEAFVVHADGRSEIVPEAALPDGAAAVVGLQDGQPVVTSVADGASITVNGEALAAGKAPRTGDELRTPNEHLVFILR